MTPAELIAHNLASLPHPSGGVLGLPGFQTRLLPAAMRDQVGQTSREIGEAIVHLLTSNGYRVVSDSDTAPIPAPAGSTPIAALTCRVCGTVLLELSLVDPRRVLTDGPALLAGLSNRSPECPHARV